MNKEFLIHIAGVILIVSTTLLVGARVLELLTHTRFNRKQEVYIIIMWLIVLTVILVVDIHDWFYVWHPLK